jgi:phage gp45-like
MTARLWDRMRRVVGYGTGALVDDSGPTQTVQLKVDALETRDKVPVLTLYGYGSNPPDGANYITIALNGDPGSMIAIASNHQDQRHRNLAAGEVIIGLPGGARLHFGAGGTTLTSGGNPVVITGDLHVTGAVIAGFGGGDQVGLQTHLHTDGTPGPTPGT